MCYSDGVTKLEPEVFLAINLRKYISPSVTFIDFSVFMIVVLRTLICQAADLYRRVRLGPCGNLKTITIPASVTTIKGMAFQVCKNLTGYIGKLTVEEIGTVSLYSVRL